MENYKMPRNSWFKKLWRWKFGNRSENRYSTKTLKRTKRFESFRRSAKVTCLDSQGKDISHLVRHSFVYDGVPGGFYLDRSHNLSVY